MRSSGVSPPATRAPPIAVFQPAIRERSDAHAVQAQHLVSHGREHASDLAVLAFTNRDGQNGRFIRAPLDVNRCSAGLALGEPHALGDPRECFIIEAAANFDQVSLRHAVAWMRDLVGELAVVGEQQESARIFVEATDREDASLVAVGDQVDRARARLARLVGAHDAARLVEQVVALAHTERL